MAEFEIVGETAHDVLIKWGWKLVRVSKNPEDIPYGTFRVGNTDKTTTVRKMVEKYMAEKEKE